MYWYYIKFCLIIFLLNFYLFNLKDAAFPDGSTPPNEVRDEWFKLLKDIFKQSPDTCIAIHCVAGLGR
jgi:protein tyrosine phosphatase type 4A